MRHSLNKTLSHKHILSTSCVCVSHTHTRARGRPIMGHLWFFMMWCDVNGRWYYRRHLWYLLLCTSGPDLLLYTWQFFLFILHKVIVPTLIFFFCSVSFVSVIFFSSLKLWISPYMFDCTEGDSDVDAFNGLSRGSSVHIQLCCFLKYRNDQALVVLRFPHLLKISFFEKYRRQSVLMVCLFIFTFTFRLIDLQLNYNPVCACVCVWERERSNSACHSPVETSSENV